MLPDKERGRPKLCHQWPVIARLSHQPPVFVTAHSLQTWAERGSRGEGVRSGGREPASEAFPLRLQTSTFFVNTRWLLVGVPLGARKGSPTGVVRLPFSFRRVRPRCGCARRPSG